MNIDFKSFKMFTPDTAEAWGRRNYGNWLPDLQNQDYEPHTPAEKLIRYYTRGTHIFYNRVPRFSEIDTYDFHGPGFTRELFDDSVYEINCHPISDDIVV